MIVYGSGVLDRRVALLRLSSMPRLTDVLSRVPTNYECLLEETAAGVLACAADHCARCPSTALCDRWIDRHEEGAGNRAPLFCAALGALRPRTVRGNARQ